MATEKMIEVKLTQRQAKLLLQCIDNGIAVIKRALVKEADDVVKERRETQIGELRKIANAVAYDGKEMV